DRERLGLAVDALLENAVRHTAGGDSIRLSVLRGWEGETARIIVADGGEGILPAELDRIFERFRTGSQLGGHPGPRPRPPRVPARRDPGHRPGPRPGPGGGPGPRRRGQGAQQPGQGQRVRAGAPPPHTVARPGGQRGTGRQDAGRAGRHARGRPGDDGKGGGVVTATPSWRSRALRSPRTAVIAAVVVTVAVVLIVVGATVGSGA